MGYGNRNRPLELRNSSLGLWPAFMVCHCAPVQFLQAGRGQQRKRCLSACLVNAIVLEVKIDRGNGDDRIPPLHECLSFASRAF
jgi:hypothetical protein